MATDAEAKLVLESANTDTENTENHIVESDAVYSEKEQLAMTQGWIPKDKFEGDEDEWISAAEFVRRGQLFGKINAQKNELRDMQKTIKALEAHHQKVQQAALEQARRELREQRKDALETGDIDRFDNIDESLRELDKQAAEEERKQVNASQDVNVAHVQSLLEDFVSRNPWYGKDAELTALADSIGTKMNERKAPPEAVLAAVEEAVRIKQASSTQQRRTGHSAVEGGRATSKQPAAKFSEKDLTGEERHAMEMFIRRGAMTKEQYMKDAALTRGISL